MRNYLTSTLIAVALLMTSMASHASPLGKQPFQQTVYVSAYVTSTASALHSGNDYNSAIGFYDQAVLWKIPAGVVVEQMYVIVDEAAVGVSALTIGDGSSATGYITSNAGIGSLGLQYYGAGLKGTYLQKQSGNIASALAGAKYYSASDSMLMSITGTATAGKMRVIIKGYSL